MSTASSERGDATRLAVGGNVFDYGRPRPRDPTFAVLVSLEQEFDQPALYEGRGGEGSIALPPDNGGAIEAGQPISKAPIANANPQKTVMRHAMSLPTTRPAGIESITKTSACVTVSSVIAPLWRHASEMRGASDWFADEQWKDRSSTNLHR